LLCIVLVIPIGLITSITGVQVTLNVFAEFIGEFGRRRVDEKLEADSLPLSFSGGLIYPENALAMNYFKTYGVMTT